VLRLARAIIPEREIGKSNYTRSLDGARLAARVMGRELAAHAVLDRPDDVFALTFDELTGEAPPEDSRALVAARTALRDDYLTTDLADKWTGPPVRVPRTRGEEPAPDTTDPIQGEASGGGVVTGRVRVVVDPSDDELEPGEILVCRTTDPSWSSLFPSPPRSSSTWAGR
jgi:pyruvate,water dikinase